MNSQMLKLDLEKKEEPKIKLPTSAGSLKKQEGSRKIFPFALLTTPKPLIVWITKTCGKFFKVRISDAWPASWEICMQVKKQQLELDMEQQMGSKLGKEYLKAVYCHSADLTYMQHTGSSSLTREQTWAPCIESAKS